MDDAVYKNSGLLFWDKLLPDLQNAESDQYQTLFSTEHWSAVEHKEIRTMVSTSSCPILQIDLGESALAVLRYQVTVDERVPAARLKIRYGEQEILDQVFAQSEDRMLRFVYQPSISEVQFELYDLDGNLLQDANRIRISIFQCIPINVQTN